MKTFFLLLSLFLIMSFISPVHGQYSDEEIEYFCEIALGGEYGDDEKIVTKWTRPIRMRILGNPTKKDLETLGKVIKEIESITNLDIKVIRAKPNLKIHFIPEKSFKSVLKEYRSGNSGFFNIEWKEPSCRIYKAVVLVSTSETSQLERDHLIREELTQALGLANDSDKYPDSIFQSEYSQVTSYSPIDVKIIKMLYSSKIKPGMSRSEILRMLKK